MEYNRIKFIIILFVSLFTYAIPLPVSHEAKIVFSIFIFAALLWTTVTIPLHLTSLFAVFLLIIFRIFSVNEAVIRFADPVILLFFGAFLIARAMEVVKLDKRVSLQISSLISNNHYEILVLMFVTAFLSMWISNTASAILLIPIALGIVNKFGKALPNFTKVAVLGIAYSANIGGIGTIIGSPPNAITTSKLLEFSQIHLSFLDWMIAALPLVLILVPLAWLLLIWIFPFEHAYLKSSPKISRLTKQQKVFGCIFLATIFLWLTTGIHGFPSHVIALVSAVVLFLFGQLKIHDIYHLNYKILVLFGGALVLGSALFTTGLSSYFANSLADALSHSSPLTVILGISLLTMGISSFASNTATAAIMVPIVLPLADILNLSPKILALVAGVSSSFAYLLPVGTPPNAIAYATGNISINDMLKAGFFLTILSLVVLSAFATLVL